MAIIFGILLVQFLAVFVVCQNVSSPTPSLTPTRIPTRPPTFKPSRAPVITTLTPTQISASPTQAPNSCPIFPTTQLTPLEDFYNSAGGPYWKYFEGQGQPWDFSVPKPNPCADQWQ